MTTFIDYLLGGAANGAVIALVALASSSSGGPRAW